MAKNLKISFIAILSLLGFYQLQAQKINGRGGTLSYLVPSGYGKELVASGCPVGTRYDWSFTRKDFGGATNTGWQDMSADWDVAYRGDELGGSVTAITNPFTPAFPNLENETPYQYKVECRSTTSPFAVTGSPVIVYINTVREPIQYTPKSINRLANVCGDLTNNNNGGRITMEADGCGEFSRWTYPDGTSSDISSNILTITNNYKEGIYQAACIVSVYDHASSSNVNVVTGSKAITINKLYAPPGPFSAYFSGVPDNTKFNIKVCKNSEGYKILTNINYELYQQYFDISWKLDNMGRGSRIIATNVGSITSNYDGIFTMTVKARDQYCGSRESYDARSTVDPLTSATIEGIKQYCPDGGTTSLTATNATNGDKYDWYVNGVLSTSLGTASTATVGETMKLKVGYTSKNSDSNGIGCKSDISDEVSITMFARPKTPTITALTKLGFCEGTPINAKLQSSLDSLSGAATKFLWSNALTTREIDVTKAGLFTVKVTDINGCTSLASEPIEVKVLPLPAAPVIAAGGPTIFCQRADSDFGTFNSVTLTATSVNDVSWYGKLSTARLLAGKVLAGVKTSDTYFTTATDLNGCISKNSNEIKVTVQANPAITSDTKILKEGVYTIKALNFPSAATVNATSAGEYEWKFGSAALISKTFVAKVKTAGDYTARRKYLYTIDGTPLTCFTDVVKYAYVVDPEFKGVAIYPNPITSSKVTIEILEDWTGADVSIYDMVGRPVFAGKIASSDGSDGRNTLEVGGLGNGIYILQVKASADKSYVGKIIVNR
jgi:hypothetical protein